MESIPTRRFTRVISVLATCSSAVALASAATITEATRLYLRPDQDSPAIGTLPAGSTYTPLSHAELAEQSVPSPPSGWVGLRHSGPYFGFADNESVAKDLVLHPASLIHARPDADSTVVHTVGAQEKVEVVEPAAGWVKVVFRDDRVVFIHTPGAAESPSAGDESPPPMEAPPRAATSAVVPPDPDETSPQLIRGYLMEARPVWRTGHQYDYQLVGEDNQRLALLDFSALLQAEPIDMFKSRLVEVYGARIDAPSVKDIVIRAETLRLAGPAAQ